MNAKSIVDMMEHAFQAGTKVPTIVFETNEGRVKFYRQTAKSRNPGAVSINDGGGYGSDVWYGCINVDGTVRTTRATPTWVVTLVASFAADTAGFAAAYGRNTERCCFCATPITTDESRSVGYGPICADHYGLPWGSTAKVQAKRAELGKAITRESERAANGAIREVVSQLDLIPTDPTADEDFADFERVDPEKVLAALEAQVAPEPALDPLVQAGAELAFYAREIAAGRAIEAPTLLGAAERFEALVVARARS